MRGADVAACHGEISHIARIQAAVGNFKGHLGLDMMRRIAHIVEALGIVIVHRPAAKGHGIREMHAVFQVVLRQDMIAQDAARFALAGQKADEIQLPVVRAVIAAILDMIPYAQRHAHKLLADLLRIAQSIGLGLAAQLNPPEIAVLVDKVMLVHEQIFICFIHIRIGRRREGHGMIMLAGGEHQRIAHRAAVGHFVGAVLIVFIARLAANAHIRIRKRRQNAVARAVDKLPGTHFVEGIGACLPANGADNAAALHLRMQARAVKQKLQVLLCHGLFVQHIVPLMPVHDGIAVNILQFDFLQNARFTVFNALGTAHRHADFAGRIAAQHRAILHQNDLRAVARSGDCRKQARQAAAHHADIRLVSDRRQLLFIQRYDINITHPRYAPFCLSTSRSSCASTCAGWMAFFTHSAAAVPAA